MRFGHTLEFTPDEYRAKDRVFAHFVFPPADGQVATERFVIVEISADGRSFDVEAEFHRKLLVVFGCDRGEDHFRVFEVERQPIIF